MYYLIYFLHVLLFAASAGGFWIYHSGPNPTVYVFRDVISVFLLNMWVYPLWPALGKDISFGSGTIMPAAGVTWTIQTMFVFYLTYPLVLRWLRGVSTSVERGRKLQTLFWVQAAWSLAQVFNLFAPVTDSLYGYWSSRGFPLGRLPVFMAGCLLATERLYGGWSDQNRATGTQELSFSTCFPGCCCGPAPSLAEIKQAAWWGGNATNKFTSYLGGLGLVITFSTVVNGAAPGLGSLVSFIFRVFVEIFVMVLFCEIIVGLTICSKTGRLYKIMTSRFLTFIGDISYSLYLVHMLSFTVFSVLVPGARWVQFMASTITSFVLGYALNKCFERPMRKLLSKKRK